VVNDAARKNVFEVAQGTKWRDIETAFKQTEIIEKAGAASLTRCGSCLFN